MFAKAKADIQDFLLKSRIIFPQFEPKLINKPKMGYKWLWTLQIKFFWHKSDLRVNKISQKKKHTK